MRRSGVCGLLVSGLAIGCVAAPRPTGPLAVCAPAAPAPEPTPPPPPLVPRALVALPPGVVAPVVPARLERQIEKPLLVTLHHHNVEPRDVAADLAKQLKRGVAVAPVVRARVTVDLDNATPRFALERVAFAMRSELTTLPGGTLLFERFRLPRLPVAVAQVMPVRVVLEMLALRACAQIIVDDEVDGPWTGTVPEGDPAHALAAVVARSSLHAARFGNLIVVSPRPLPAGDLDLDPDKDWREGLATGSVEVDVRDPDALALVAAATKVGRVNVALAGSPQHVHLLALAGAVPWTDLVTLAARLENARVRRDGQGLVLEPSRAGQGLAAAQAPANALLSLLADAAGKHLVACPRLRSTFTVSHRAVAPEDALAGLAALLGLVVLPAGDGLTTLVPVGVRPLESLNASPSPEPVRLPDGRFADLRLEAAVVWNNRRSALVSGRACHLEDEIVLPGAPAGEVARVSEILASRDSRLTLDVSGPTIVDAGGPVVLVMPP